MLHTLRAAMLVGKIAHALDSPEHLFGTTLSACAVNRVDGLVATMRTCLARTVQEHGHELN